jgi:hypothetical protein
MYGHLVLKCDNPKIASFKFPNRCPKLLLGISKKVIFLKKALKAYWSRFVLTL